MRLLALAATVLAAAPLLHAQSYDGALADGDGTLTSGEYADAYEIEVEDGQSLLVNLTSADFDPYLIVTSPSGEQLDNDDWADNLGWSRVEIPSAEGGTWYVLVTSYDVGETGAYSLTLATATTPPADAALQDVTVCYLDGALLTEDDALYDPSTGDTTLDGALFSTSGYEYSDWIYELGRYAGQTSWYVNNEPVGIGGATYVKFGLPRVLSVYDVAFLAEVDGAAVFAEPGAGNTPEIVYVAVRPGCEFQPYQREIE